jgi:antitoxin ParD1/3/4
VSLNPQLQDYIQGLLVQGSYTSKSEIINEALRTMQKNDLLYQQRVQNLRQELNFGINQAESGDFSKANATQIFQKAKKIVNSKIELK